MNRIPSQSGKAFILKKDQILHVMDVEGQQVSDLFCAHLNDRNEILSCARTWDYNDTVLVTEGSKLYSNGSLVMLEIVKDTCGRHDLLMPPCSLKMFQIVGGNLDHHPSCHENLAINLKEFGIQEYQIHNTLNIFMNVEFDNKGALKISKPLSQKGDVLSLKAHMDLIVGLTACSHEETNGGCCKPIDFWIE